MFLVVYFNIKKTVKRIPEHKSFIKLFCKYFLKEEFFQYIVKGTTIEKYNESKRTCTSLYFAYICTNFSLYNVK